MIKTAFFNKMDAKQEIEPVQQEQQLVANNEEPPASLPVARGRGHYNMASSSQLPVHHDEQNNVPPVAPAPEQLQVNLVLRVN